MCLCASEFLGSWHCVRGPPGPVGDAHSRLAVAARPVHFTDGDLRLLLLGMYRMFNSDPLKIKPAGVQLATEPPVFRSGCLRVLVLTCCRGKEKEPWEL